MLQTYLTAHVSKKIYLRSMVSFRYEACSMLLLRTIFRRPGL